MLILVFLFFFFKRTVNAVVEFFQTSKGMDLERLTTATLMKLEEIKERTATGKIATNLSEDEPLKCFNTITLTLGLSFD